MSLKLDWESSEANKKMNEMPTKLTTAVMMYAATKAPQLRSYMQANRPWTDRTGKAKATLNATVSKPQTNVVRITLSHGVYYGIWLELAHEKNYAILAPTLNTQGPKVITDLRTAGIMMKIV